LGAAAALSLYTRCGCLPAADPEPPPEPAEPDALPRCSPRSAEHLALMLSGRFREALPEWLAAAAAAGRRVPERLLPDLLSAGRTHAELRPGIAPVLGRRGAWLAAQNEEW